MPVIPEQLTRSGGLPTASVLERQLLAGETLLAESANHLMQVVDVLESYGLVLDAYSRNLIYQAETQFLNPFPIFKFLDGDHRPAKIWRHLIHDRINFEYAEYCMRAMLWHGTGGLDAYLDSEAFQELCRAIIRRKTQRDPLLALLHPLFPDFLPELIREPLLLKKKFTVLIKITVSLDKCKARLFFFHSLRRHQIFNIKIDRFTNLI
jgi:hypothetical protein